MPKLTIDGLEVEVPEGLSVLEAAKKLGIVIPHFCYHDALGSVGACRLCAMKFIEGPVKGVQMSCMVKAADGMVVQTADPDAMRVRRMVIEWLMTNHPHDCPVCDEGGMCLLQDYTIAGGHGRRRYKGKKRTYLSQYLGEFIEQEMNRCIQCYRCHRFYRDYAGGKTSGRRGSRTRHSSAGSRTAGLRASSRAIWRTYAPRAYSRTRLTASRAGYGSLKPRLPSARTARSAAIPSRARSFGNWWS